MRAFFSILFFSWLFTLFFPWWVVVIPGMIFGAMFLKSGVIAFFIGFTAAGLAWFIQVLYIDIANESILSTRISDMMGIGPHWILMLITFLIAALTGGLATVVGYLLKAVFKPEREIGCGC